MIDEFDNDDALVQELTKPEDPFISFVKSKLEEASDARNIKEQKWQDNVKAMRGEDSGPSLRAETEVKSIYVKTTATKTKAAYSQLSEALLGNDRFPISVESTTRPEGIAEFAHVKADQEAAGEPELNPLNVGYAGDGVELPAGARAEDMSSILGDVYSQFDEENFQEGVDPTGAGMSLTPAKKAARMMEKTIHDQLEESKAKTALRKALYEACMLGTGAMKGPFTEAQITNIYGPEGEQSSTLKPRLKFTSIWNLYIDPNAQEADDISYVIERHRMNRTQVSNLVNMPGFDVDYVNELAMSPGNYTLRSFETTLRPDSGNEQNDELFEVLEYWGYMDKNKLEEYGIAVPDSAESTVQVNAWICADKILRLSINPFKPARIPYFIFPYEQDPYSIYGVGVPELMEDLQVLMNGMTRLAVENAMLAGNVILDVDTTALSPTEDMSIYPGKIFKRVAGAQNTAINSVQIPFVANQNMQMFSQFRQMTDEATGIPSILHGQTGVAGTGRTSSGLAMLMDSGSMTIKNVIRNIDDQLLKPIGLAYYQWNMQFKTEELPEIKGDLNIKAMGSHNLISKERKAQKLQTFLQLSTNPALAPFIKLPTIIKDLAVQMEISPEEILNSPEEAMVYAQIQAVMNPQQAQAGSLPNEPTAPPGSEGFTGNTAGAGNVQGVTGEQPPSI